MWTRIAVALFFSAIGDVMRKAVLVVALLPFPLAAAAFQCAEGAGVYAGVLDWKVGDSGIVRSPALFGPGVIWLIVLTTPASGNYYGTIAFFEYFGPPGMKHATLSATPCGPPISPYSQLDEFYPVVRFSLGVSPAPNYPLLQPSTTYYLSLETDVAGGTAVEMELQTE